MSYSSDEETDKKSYFSDEELDEYDISRIKEYDLISHFSLEDYLKCQQTRTALLENWNNAFYENMNDKLEDVFERMQYDNENNDLLALSQKKHASVFFEMIKHHVVPQLDTGIFEEDPHLGKPLLYQIDEIREKERFERKLNMMKNMNSASKDNKWKVEKTGGTPKKKSLKEAIDENSKTNDILFKDQIAKMKEEEQKTKMLTLSISNEKPKNRFLGK